MKVKVYNVVSRAVEEGINHGYRRAHKHTDNPGLAAIKDAIYNEVMNALCDVIDFDEEEVDLLPDVDEKKLS
jgi:hypothetical protein